MFTNYDSENNTVQALYAQVVLQMQYFDRFHMILLHYAWDFQPVKFCLNYYKM